MSQTSPKILTLNQIQKYSQCPRKFGYSILSKQVLSTTDDFLKVSVKTLIKQCYANRSQHGYNPQWDTIKSRVNKLCFQDTDINDKEAYKLSYKRSIGILRVMHHWYYKVFSNDSREGLVNIPLSALINNTQITSTLDIAIMDNEHQIIPVIFNDNDILPSMLYNNMEFKSLLWLIYQATNVYPELVYYLSINEYSVQKHEIYNKTKLHTIDKYINFIIRAIDYQVYYPSIGPQCSDCEYKDICNI